MPATAAGLGAVSAGMAMGAINGALVAYVRIPSIVVTLATMVALRDGLRWATQGAWVSDLPPGFQWLGLSQSSYPVLIGAPPSHPLAESAGACVIWQWGASSTRQDRTRKPRALQASIPDFADITVSSRSQAR